MRSLCLRLGLSLTFTLPAVATGSFYVPGQLLVKPKRELSHAEFVSHLKARGAVYRKRLGRTNVHVLGVEESRAEAVLEGLRHDEAIAYVERDWRAKAAFVPNDPYVVSGQEWQLARIQAEQAWDYTVGVSNVIVAVLDSGINAAHPDLAGRVLPGYNFVGSDSDTSDTLGHGTAVAGVIAADGNNGIGVAGVAYGCSLLPVKVVDETGFAAYSAIIEGLNYATDQGVRVINISIAGGEPSSALQEAIAYAWSNNVLVVAAAGNNSNTNAQYPAACVNVVAVSATDQNDFLASFSSYGSYVSLAAPGVGLWTTDSGLSYPYDAWSGTSFASPVVAGVAALMASANSALSNVQIVSLLEQTADDVGPSGYSLWFGYGRVNAFRAVTAANPGALPSPPQPPGSPGQRSAGPQDSTPPSVRITSGPPNGARLRAGLVSLTGTASANHGLDHVEVQLNGSVAQVALGTTNWSAQIWLAPGLNRVGVRSVDVAGNASSDATRDFTWVVLMPLVVQTNGLGRVEPDLNAALLEVGRVYRVRAVPGPMQIFSGWSAADGSSPLLSFTMQSNLTLVANFVPSPFPPVQGSYAGLMADTNGVTPASSGYFTLTVTPMGQFTGRLRVARSSYPVRGQFDLSGNAATTIPGAGFSSRLALSLQLDLSGSSDTVAGSVNGGGWTAQLVGDRNVFSKLNPAQQAGSRAFVLDQATEPAAQAGAGVGNIAQTGATRVKAALSGGRSFAASSWLSKTGDYPLYVSLNQGAQVVIGWLNFAAGQGQQASGTLVWAGSGTNSFATSLQVAPGQ